MSGIGRGEPLFDEIFFSSQEGLRLYARDYGRRNHAPGGLAVLCLPGLTRTCKDYADLAPHLATRYRVLCPDYRGIGRSQYGAGPQAYTPAAWIADVHDLLAVANVHRVVVIGMSFGGLVAAGLAVAAPGLLAGAVLDDIGPEMPQAIQDKVLSHVGLGPGFDDWEAAADHLQRSFPGMPADTPEKMRRITENCFREGPDGRIVPDWDPAIGHAITGFGSAMPDFWSLFRALARVPVLAIRGAESDILVPAIFDRMADEMPGLARLTVPGVGHAPDPSESPAVERIDEFLNAL